MSKKQIIAIIATLLLLIAIPLGMYLARKQQTVKSRATDCTVEGDINCDGCIKADDYAWWRQNYPDTSAPGAYDKYARWLEKYKSHGGEYCVSPP